MIESSANGSHACPGRDAAPDTPGAVAREIGAVGAHEHHAAVSGRMNGQAGPHVPAPLYQHLVVARGVRLGS